MTWTSRRQLLYLTGFIVVLLVVVGLPAFFYFYNPPSCSDGIQNGLEEGVDCGGDCAIICSFKAADPIIHWSRLFEVAPGVYSVVAFVENSNLSFETDNVPFAFKLRDSQGVLVYEQKGSAYLPARYTVPVFATSIRTGERTPVRAEFEFLREPVWSESAGWESGISVVARTLESADTEPRLRATIRNTTLVEITDMPIVALLFDAEGNALHTSRTVIDRISGGADLEIVFTWPEAFPRPVTRIDIVPIPTRTK